MAVRTIETELILSGEKSFNDQMKAVNSNLKNLKSDMAACSAEFKGSEKSMAALRAKAKILNEQVEQQKEKVRALADQYERCRSELGEDAAQTDKYRQELNNAKAALSKMEEEQENTNDELKQANPLYAKAKELLEKLGPAAKKAGSAILTIAKGMLNATGKIAKWSAALGAAAATASGAAMVSGIKTLLEWGDVAVEQATKARWSGKKLTEAQKDWLAYSKTLTGMKRSAEDAKAAMATILLPALTSLSTEGSVLLENFSQAMSDASGDPEAMARVITEYIKYGAQLIQIKLPEIMEMAGDFIDALGDGFDANKEEILAAAQQIITTLVDGAVSHADDIGKVIVELGGALGEAIVENGPELLNAGLEIFAQILLGIMEALPGFLTEDLPEMLVEIFNKLVELAPQFKDAGAEMFNQFWEGLKDLAPGITGWIEEIVNFWKDLFAGVKDDIAEARANVIADPNDPSLYGGYATGLNYVPYDNFPAMLHKGEQVLTATQSAQYRAGESGGSGGSGTVELIINVTSELDGKVLSKKVYKELKTLDRNAGTKYSGG